MLIFNTEIQDGLQDVLSSHASISYASAVEPCSSTKYNAKKFFKSLASFEDSDLYYTQSILVSSSWNKNDDIFDKSEVWLAKNSPEDKPTNLEHDEGTIIGHIVSNWPITQDGILIDNNTPMDNLPEKYHILTGAVIYRAFTQPELRERTEALIAEIENGTKFVSMECFFKGFDYGLINKNTNEYKVLSRDESTAHLTKYLRAYGGLGEHEDYRIGRVLRNITFSGKGYVDKPANPDSIIFSNDSFKFLQNPQLTKNDDILKSGVIISKSSIHSENQIMNENIEVATVVDCTEATLAAETTITELTTELESSRVALAAVQIELDGHLEAAKKSKEMLDMEEDKKDAEMKKMKASISDLEAQLIIANELVSAAMQKEKKMARKASLMNSGFDSEKADSIVEKFESLNDETFASMAEFLSAGLPPWLEESKKNKKNDKSTKGESNNDMTEVLENVEETATVDITVGGEDDSLVENTRAALVDFVYARLGKKLNKGE